MWNSNSIETVEFHKDTTTPKEGNQFNVKHYKSLTLEIHGTSTSREVKFYGKVDSGIKRVISGFRLPNYEQASSTIGTGEVWYFDVTGLSAVLMEVTDVSGGYVYIRGKLVP